MTNSNYILAVAVVVVVAAVVGAVAVEYLHNNLDNCCWWLTAGLMALH